MPWFFPPSHWSRTHPAVFLNTNIRTPVMKSGWCAKPRRVRDIIMTHPAMIRSSYADRKCMFIVRNAIRRTAARWFPQEVLRQLRPPSVLLRSRMSCTALTAARMIPMPLSQTAMPPEKKKWKRIQRKNPPPSRLPLMNQALKKLLPTDWIRRNLMQRRLIKRKLAREKLLPKDLRQEMMLQVRLTGMAPIPLQRIRKIPGAGTLRRIKQQIRPMRTR